MTKPYRRELLAPTTGAVSWSIAGHDEFDLERIVMNFDAAPTTVEYITISLDSVDGSDYDAQLYVLSPVGACTLKVEDMGKFLDGDVITVTYTNTDGNTVSGSALYSI